MSLPSTSATQIDYLSLSQLGHIITGKTPSTRQSEYYGGDIPFLTPSDDLSYKYVSTTQKTLTEEGLRTVRTCILPANALAVTCIGTHLGRVVITREPTVTNQQFNALIVDEKRFDVDYIYYALTTLSPQLKELSKSSTAIPIVNKSSFAALTIPVPPLAEQRRRAAILRAVDDRLTVSRSLAANIQEQARLLYRRWFIDYDFPNEEGAPYQRSGGKVRRKSVLGLIPRGWKVGKLSDLAEVTSGGTPATKNAAYWDGAIPFFTTKDATSSTYIFVTSKTLTAEGLKHCRSKLYPPDTIFITARGTVGKIMIAGVPMAMNQSCCAISVRKRFSPAYLHLMLLELVASLQNKANGVVYDAITARDLLQEAVIMPPRDIVAAFAELVRTHYEMLMNCERQILILTEQLDALKKKIISPEAKK